MNYTAEQINNAFSNLSPEEAEAMFQVNIDAKINEIKDNYNLNTEETSSISLYTTLSVIGLIKKEELPQILKKEFSHLEENVFKIIFDINKNIFEEIQQIIQKKKERKDIIEQSQKEISDPHFSQLPENVQDAISKSNWRETLYEIAKKYKLNIEQMGALEESTVAVISNTISPNSYEKELSSKISIPKDDLSNLVSDINNNLMKKIREIMKTQDFSKTEDRDESVPLPPYRNTANNQEPKTQTVELEPLEATKEKLSEIKNDFIISKNAEIPNEVQIPKPSQITPNIFNVPKNIIEEKLQGATSSKHSTSDHSNESGVAPSYKAHDPYREEI